MPGAIANPGGVAGPAAFSSISGDPATNAALVAFVGDKVAEAIDELPPGSADQTARDAAAAAQLAADEAAEVAAAATTSEQVDDKIATALSELPPGGGSALPDDTEPFAVRVLLDANRDMGIVTITEALVLVPETDPAPVNGGQNQVRFTPGGFEPDFSAFVPLNGTEWSEGNEMRALFEWSQGVAYYGLLVGRDLAPGVSAPLAPTLALGTETETTQPLVITPNPGGEPPTTYHRWVKLSTDSVFTEHSAGPDLDPIITGLTGGLTYSYYVVPEGAGGLGAASNTVTGATASGALSGSLSSFYDGFQSEIQPNLTTVVLALGSPADDWRTTRGDQKKLSNPGDFTFGFVNANYSSAGSPPVSWDADDASNNAGVPIGAGSYGECIWMRGSSQVDPELPWGIQGSALADGTLRTLRLYFAIYREDGVGALADIAFSATMSDGSAPDWQVGIRPGNDQNKSCWVDLTFKAGGPGQSVNWTALLDADDNGEFGVYAMLWGN